MNGKSENHSCCAANASRALAPQTFRRVPRCRLVGLEEVAQTHIGRHRIHAVRYALRGLDAFGGVSAVVAVLVTLYGLSALHEAVIRAVRG